MELIKLKKQIDLLEKAFITLEDAFKQDSFTDLEKDWVIQRFEYTIELSWKTCRKFLDYQKVDYIQSPREILKYSFKLWVIDDLEKWNEFIDIRNYMSHMYSEFISWESFEFIEKNYKEIRLLLDSLKKSIK